MNDNHDNAGKWIVTAAFAVLTAAVTAALIHKPTREKIRTTLEDGIDASDKRLDEVEQQVKHLASQAGRKLNSSRNTTVADLQDRLADLQKKLDKIS